MSLGCSQLPRPMVIPSLDILIVFAQAADPRNPPWIASHPGGFWPGRRSSRSIGDSPSLGSADHCNIERVAKGGVGGGGRLGIGGGRGGPRGPVGDPFDRCYGSFRGMGVSVDIAITEGTWFLMIDTSSFFLSSSRTRNVNQSGLSPCVRKIPIIIDRSRWWRFFFFFSEGLTLGNRIFQY